MISKTCRQSCSIWRTCLIKMKKVKVLRCFYFWVIFHHLWSKYNLIRMGKQCKVGLSMQFCKIGFMTIFFRNIGFLIYFLYFLTIFRFCCQLLTLCNSKLAPWSDQRYAIQISGTYVIHIFKGFWARLT